MEIEVNDWFRVVDAPDGNGAKYYQVRNLGADDVEMEMIRTDGSSDRAWFHRATIEALVKTGIWQAERSVTACNRRCDKCGQVGDHRGMVYYPMEGECRFW